jgi:predicted dehydrogenase
LPPSHWTHDPEVGGGRIVGEVCHFVDFASFVAGAGAVGASAGGVAGSSEPRDDNVVATVGLADGSVASITYTSLGDSAMPKERIEVVGEAGAGVLDDFRQLDLHRGGATKTSKGRRDKGHAAEIACFLDSCRTGAQPWPVVDMLSVMRATFDIRDSLRAPSGPAG